MFVAPVSLLAAGVDDKYSTSPDINQEGFSQTTSLVATNNQLPDAAGHAQQSVSHRLPAGLRQLARPADLRRPGHHLPKSARPRAPTRCAGTSTCSTASPRTLMLEVAYIGNHAVHLPDRLTPSSTASRASTSARWARAMPTRAISPLPWPTRSPDCKPRQKRHHYSELSCWRIIPNSRWATAPPAGAARRHPRSRTSTTAALISRASTSAWKNALRMAHVRIQLHYSRLMERVSWLNDSDPVPEKRVSPDRSPAAVRHRHHLRTARRQGKALDFHSGLANSVIGGWR